MMWRVTVVAYLKAIFQNFYGGTEETYWIASKPTLLPGWDLNPGHSNCDTSKPSWVTPRLVSFWGTHICSCVRECAHARVCFSVLVCTRASVYMCVQLCVSWRVCIRVCPFVFCLSVRKWFVFVPLHSKKSCWLITCNGSVS
jgi:hypothetical protein